MKLHIHIYTWYMYITYIEDVMYVRLIVHTCAHDVLHTYRYFITSCTNNGITVFLQLILLVYNLNYMYYEI